MVEDKVTKLMLVERKIPIHIGILNIINVELSIPRKKLSNLLDEL